MRVLYVGCVMLSEHFMRTVMGIPEAELVGVVSRSAAPKNADFVSLLPIAANAGIPALDYAPEDDDRLAKFVAKTQPDVLFCFGWSHLLPMAIVDALPLGGIGYHPAELPMNRGRHPLIWALTLGLDRTASTFFMLAEEPDAGDIVSQVPIAISENDDAGSLYRKVVAAGCAQLREFVTSLARGTLTPTPQKGGMTNFWRKRTPADGRIDWRMSARSIYNLVRALARPYPGADCAIGDGEAKVWKVAVVDLEMANAEPGKVISLEHGGIVVKCGEGCVRVIEHEFPRPLEEGTYL